LTTSNVTKAIDLAFVDRADIKKFIGLPSPNVLYKILEGCVLELIKVVIKNCLILTILENVH
jgi:pachytene checkpoint protein 2